MQIHSKETCSESEDMSTQVGKKCSLITGLCKGSSQSYRDDRRGAKKQRRTTAEFGEQSASEVSHKPSVQS